MGGIGVGLLENSIPATFFRWFVQYIYAFRALAC